MDACLLLFFAFPQGDRIEYMLLGDWDRDHSNGKIPIPGSFPDKKKY